MRLVHPAYNQMYHLLLPSVTHKFLKRVLDDNKPRRFPLTGLVLEIVNMHITNPGISYNKLFLSRLKPFEQFNLYQTIRDASSL